MPIIECFDCGATVSDSAESCPQCSFPVRKRQGNFFQRLAREPRATLSVLDVAKSTVGRVVAGGLMFAAASDLSSTVLAIVALGLTGSAIPLWFKGLKTDRLGGGSNQLALEEEVNRALADAEERDIQQLADIEQNANRILALEERLEFTERLLAKQPDDREKLEPGG